MSINRDRSIEALLRAHHADDDDARMTQQCVDSEVLAAWVDGGLTDDVRASVETHAAGCARCQALFASMARTAPHEEARPWWRSVTVKWLVPVAAAVTALVVWVEVERSSAPATTAPAQVAQTPAATTPPETAAASPALPPAAADKPADARPAPSTDNKQSAVLSRRERIDRLEQDSARSGSQPPRPAEAPTPLGGAARERADGNRQQASTGDMLSRRTTPASPADAPAAAGPPPPVAAPVPVSAQPVTVTAPPTAVAEAASPRPPQPAAKALAGLSSVPAATIEIPSPEPNYRWRIAAPSSVQRSTDAGVTWSIVDPLPARASVAPAPVLLAGSSPSRDVCWIVGRAGLVLLSTDGATWQRRPFPEAVDLIAARASTATNAIVTAADGRQFATSDRGATWVLVR
jgi:hypothetical protein